MKKEHKKLSIAGFIAVIVLIVACVFVAVMGVGEKHQGAAKNIALGLDLAGGVSVTYEIEDENPSQSDINDTIYKLQNRVQAYSNDAVVYQEGGDRISVEIPGFYDADTILKSLGAPGTLYFMEIVEGEPETEGQTGSGTEAETEGQTESGTKTETEGQTEAETAGQTENETEGQTEKETEGTTADEPTSYLNVVCAGEDIEDAQVGTRTNTFGNSEYVVELKFTPEGTTKFAEATERNVGKIIYIIYDGAMISAPTVNTAITNGEAYIEGDFTYESANALATSIRLGSLNLTLHDIRSNVVGAQLGDEAISTSLLAGLIGLIIIIILMIVLFRIPGLASGIALILYVLMMLLLLNALDITLTLPGIAGIILSIGMAVDANVIIFTRIKEETGLGQPVNKAIKAGFHRATSAILDGNITTLIAAAVLYAKGTGSIRGFAITLALGIIVSMITAMLVTRVVLSGLYHFGAKSVKFYGQKVDKKPFNYTKKRPLFYAISAVLIVIGVITMAVNSGGGKGALNWGLDFTGGTSMTMTFEEHLDVTSAEGQELRAIVEKQAGTSDVQLQNVTGTNEIVIKTPALESDARESLKKAIKENYKIDETLTTEESISGVISDEMRSDAVIAVVIATICMLVYIWIRFKDVRFGLSAIIALVHDVLVVIMVYAVLRISVGNTFIACMLTIVGYSINATIVIFDRIRENQKLMRESSLEHIVNTSISQTFTRSIYTSLTTFIMVLVLYIVGVTSIREFALPLMAGIVCGAFSSVCIAGNLWYTMQRKKIKDRNAGKIIDGTTGKVIEDKAGKAAEYVKKAANDSTAKVTAEAEKAAEDTKKAVENKVNKAAESTGVKQGGSKNGSKKKKKKKR
ncbi:MAG: protein translocase subunit SecD [Lachnospiraceae bacterium]|nr:protein translocase subunit SecD [Lachnospiraceae bacterium]